MIEEDLNSKQNLLKIILENDTLDQLEKLKNIEIEEEFGKKIYNQGNFQKDKIDKIVDILVYKNNKIVCEVEWQHRINGTKKKNSFYLYEFLYNQCPQKLLDHIIKLMRLENSEDNIIDIPTSIIIQNI